LAIDPLPEEKRLLAATAAGDEQSFALLFEHYHRWIYATSMRLTRSSELAEEIVLDVFMKVWLRRSSLITIDHFEPYLFAMARNHAFTALKNKIRNDKKLVEYAGRLSGHEGHTEEKLVIKDYEAIVREAVQKLPSRQQEVYQLSRFYDMTREQIADQLGISPNTVKIHLREALYSIRTHLARKLDLPLFLAALAYESLK